MKIVTTLLVWLLLIHAPLRAQSPARSLAPSIAKTTRLYTSSACGIRFRIPSNWIATEKHSIAKNAGAPGSKEVCLINLAPPNLNQLLTAYDVNVYSVELHVLNQSYDDALKDSGFEKNEKGNWVVLGRQNIEDPAEELSTPAWKGIKGVATSGCFHETGEGGYAGLCDVSSAVLSNRKSMVVTIEAGAQAEQVFETMLKSLVFISLN